MTTRYAIFFAPGMDSPWWKFGTQWLGRNEINNSPMTPADSILMSQDEQLAVTREPRRYGFHATLKAPFRLAGNKTQQDIEMRIQSLAANLSPVPLGPLRALNLGKFVALQPLKSSDELAAVAEACVVGLDDLRAALSTEELARRQIVRLDSRELELLRRYGYPYVLERFRFHFTLSGPVDQPTRQRITQAVATTVAQLNADAPLMLDRLCLFKESAPGLTFQRVADVVLSA